jgi:hypothetical protein
MKIIYLHQYFNTPAMRGSTRSYELARRLVRMGNEVHMVTSERQPDGTARGWRETDESGIHVHWLPVPYSQKMSYPDRMRAFGSFAVSSAQRAAQLGGDVVFATSTPLTIAVPGIAASRWNRRPMVFGICGPPSPSPWAPSRAGRPSSPRRCWRRPPTRGPRTSSRSRRG